MFNKTFGNVAIQQGTSKKRGMCLRISQKNGQRILVDYCGMNPELVPDGTNAYFFGNKLVVLTRRSDLTETARRRIETCDLVLVAHPYDCVQFSLRIGEEWGEVNMTLPHCYNEQNDEKSRVDEILFLFSDTHDENYVICRSVTVPSDLGRVFQTALRIAHKAFSMDGKLDALREKAQTDPRRDFYDLLYEACGKATSCFAEQARRADPTAVSGGVYVYVNGNNEIADIQGLPNNASDKINEKDEGRALESSMYDNKTAETENDLMSSEARDYQRRAEDNDPEAQYNLGVCYERGDGTKQSYAEAAHWYGLAAEQGYAKARYNLGVLYYDGNGLAKDRRLAAELFLLAAEQGDVCAQYNVGVCYHLGEGVERDMVKAGKWLRQAAEQGHPKARRALGLS